MTIIIYIQERNLNMYNPPHQVFCAYKCVGDTLRQFFFVTSHRAFEMNGRVGLLFVLLLCLLIDAEPRDGKLIRRQKRIVGGIAAAPPPEDDPVVFINKNGRYARIIGGRDSDKRFYTFRGIRFGEPPTGRSRFQVKIQT